MGVVGNGEMGRKVKGTLVFTLCPLLQEQQEDPEGFF